MDTLVGAMLKNRFAVDDKTAEVKSFYAIRYEDIFSKCVFEMEKENWQRKKRKYAE
jgi:hypothetical protein